MTRTGPSIMRLFPSGIAAAALLGLIATAPATAQESRLRKGQASGDGIGSWSAATHKRSANPYKVYRDRSGFGLRTRGGQAVNHGWGCPTCGFKNRAQLTGLDAAARMGPVVIVILPSGGRIDPR